MSLFDPQHIYRKSPRITQRGQIIQKKPVERNPPLGVKDKEKAIHILKCFGLKAVPINAPPEPVLTIYKDGLWLPMTINFTTLDPQQYTVTFNKIWTVIAGRLDPILVYEDKVVDSLVEFYIQSIEYNIHTNNNNVNVNLNTNKINWNNTINQSTGVLAVPLNKSQFRYLSFRPGAWGNQFNQAFAHTDSLTALAYDTSDDISIYQQLCQNHQVDNDFTVAQITTANGYITTFNLNIIMSIKVEYLDYAEPA